jgi:hypothetical protein
MYNKCSSGQNAYKPGECGSTPAPVPTPPAPTASSFAEKVVTELFKLLKITDVDPSTCVSDVGGADVLFRDFAQDAAAGNASTAVVDLSKGLSALSSSVAGCGLTEVQAKIDLLAASIRWANISTAGFDKDVKVIVDASDLWNDITALGKAVIAKDTTAVGTAIGNLLTEWTTVTGGCSASNKACNILDGILKVVQVVATEAAPCEQALSGPVTELESAATLFRAHNYTGAVAAFATALDGVAQAVGTDGCGLHNVASVISSLSPKLAKAVVTVENSTAVRIMVGSANVYDTLFKAVTDLENGNPTDFGVQMGLLLSDLRTSGCSTKACTVLEGLLQSLQLEASDYTACTTTVDAAWGEIPTALAAFEQHQWVNGLSDVGSFLTNLASSVKSCDIPGLSKILEDTATKLNAQGVATAIGDVEQVLVEGSDVTLDIQKLIVDFRGNQWASVGHDLGTLASWLDGTGCKSFVCKIAEGLLNAAAIPFQNLETCETDLKLSEQSFTAGAASLAQKQYKDALVYWATGLNDIAKGVQDCGLASELSFIEQEANVLGFGNVTVLGEAATILVHGSDVYQELFAAVQAFSSHDYRTAGSEIGTVMNQLSNWTTGHSCTHDFCYVVTGIMQFMGDIEGDLKACEADFEHGFRNFTAAFEVLHSSSSTGGSDFHFTTSSDKIHQGIGDIGNGLKDLAKGVGDCHMQQFAEILTALAVKLGVVPEVSWIEELLKIVIDGVQIENEVGDACLDYSQGNWVGFGYNIAKLTRTLL